MKIYTRTGDGGETGLFGGGRVDKDDARVEAYGAVDETNSVIGMARAHGVSASVETTLSRVQAELFVLGAELSTTADNVDKLRMPLIGDAEVTALEHAIDDAEHGLPELVSFVLPTGHPGAAALHVARTTCRRAERALVHARREHPVRAELVRYMNRLSDLLFSLARRANHDAGVPDVPWVPTKQPRKPSR